MISHTIDKVMAQVDRIYGRKVRILAGDRGYRGQEKTGETKIMVVTHHMSVW